MSVLIVTMPGDVHAHAVCWAIEKLGGHTKLLYPADLCAGAQWHFDPSTLGLSIEYESSRDRIEFEDYHAVWMRRPPAILPQEQMGDRVERAASEDDFRTLTRSIYLLLERDRFAVNPLDNAHNAGLKPFQFAMARQSGLNVPRTLTGNSPEAILAFYDECDGDIIFKPFKGSILQTASGPRMVPTTRLSREMLLSCDLSAAPGIFQQHVPKSAEIRATIMGRTIFAWEKRFEGREKLDVDWRFLFKGAKHKPHQLPPSIEEACFILLDKLGLVFGCFDFIIDDLGRYVFLEVNPQGQWLWGDAVNDGLNQLEGMAEFLLSGDPHFQYSGRGQFRLADYRANVDPNAVKLDESSHYGHLMTFMYYQSSFKVETRFPD